MTRRTDRVRHAGRVDWQCLGANAAAATHHAGEGARRRHRRVLLQGEGPKALAKWYADNLGVGATPTGYGQEPWQHGGRTTAIAAVSGDHEIFGRPEQAFMLNFRVRNLDAMVAQLRRAGITVDVDPESIRTDSLRGLPIRRESDSVVAAGKPGCEVRRCEVRRREVRGARCANSGAKSWAPVA